MSGIARTVDVVVGRNYIGRHAALVTLDGVLTSWDCTHNHATPELAAKCERRLLASAIALLRDYTIEERLISHDDSDDTDLVEWTWLGVGGATRSMRFRYYRSGQAV